MQELSHVVRLFIGAGCLISSLRLLGIIIVPGYGGYSSDDTSNGRAIFVVREAVRGKENHANHILVIAG